MLGPSRPAGTFPGQTPGHEVFGPLEEGTVTAGRFDETADWTQSVHRVSRMKVANALRARANAPGNGYYECALKPTEPRASACAGTRT